MKNDFKIKWEYIEGNKISAPLYYFNDYVISCWNEGYKNACYCLRYRPINQHINLGDFETIEQAKEAAETHYKNLVDNSAVEV